MKAQDAIREVIALNGTPVCEDESVYGWVDYDAKYHVLDCDACAWVVPTDAVPVRVHVVEFVDTFSDNREYESMEVRGCSCECGQYKNITLRYEDSIYDFIQNLLKVSEE